MARKSVEVEVPDGQHLGFSRNTDGALRAHLFDDETNQLAGHAELFEVDEDDGTSPGDGIPWTVPDCYMPSAAHETANAQRAEAVAAVLAELVVLGVSVGAIKAAPHVRRWLDRADRPAIASARLRLNRFRTTGRRETSTEEAAPLEATTSDRASDPAALIMHGPAISSTEAQQRFLAMMRASAFVAEQFRTLSTVRIVDDAPGQVAMVDLGTQSTADSINRAPSANPGLLDKRQSTVFIRLFERSWHLRRALPAGLERFATACTSALESACMPSDPAGLAGASFLKPIRGEGARSDERC